jgi:hypothetical protein
VLRTRAQRRHLIKAGELGGVNDLDDLVKISGSDQKHARRESNLQPSASEADALSS